MPTLNLSAVDAGSVVNKSHAAVELESEELLVVLLPAMGRVYRVINKHTTHDVLWRNDIARPGGANNKLGWWLWLGGVEYTLPGEEHGYTWALPWVWSVVEDSAARKAVQAMVREPSTGLVETLTFSLALNDSAALRTDVLIFNPSSETQKFAHWHQRADGAGRHEPARGRRRPRRAHRSRAHRRSLAAKPRPVAAAVAGEPSSPISRARGRRRMGDFTADGLRAG